MGDEDVTHALTDHPGLAHHPATPADNGHHPFGTLLKLVGLVIAVVVIVSFFKSQAKTAGGDEHKKGDTATTHLRTSGNDELLLPDTTNPKDTPKSCGFERFVLGRAGQYLTVKGGVAVSAVSNFYSDGSFRLDANEEAVESAGEGFPFSEGEIVSFTAAVGGACNLVRSSTTGATDCSRVSYDPVADSWQGCTDGTAACPESCRGARDGFFAVHNTGSAH